MTLPHPIGSQRRVLDEATFRKVYLETDYTIMQVSEVYKIPLKCIQGSVKYYKQIIPNEIQQKARRGYQAAAYRRTPGTHVRHEVKVDKDKLVSLLAEGRTEWDIAKEMEVAPQTIRKNIRRYGLLVPSKKARNITDEEWLHLEWANQLVPGLLDSAYRGNDNPSKFYHLIYDAFIKMCFILWTLQKLGRRYNHHLIRNNLPRDHVSWRINKQEIILSEKLRELGIAHVREYLWAKSAGRNYSADIFIPSTNLLVEINGNVHSIGFVIDHDKDKERLVDQLGYKRLMFLASEIDKELDIVIMKIEKEMK